jgi:hypothetical protein
MRAVVLVHRARLHGAVVEVQHMPMLLVVGGVKVEQTCAAASNSM